MKNFEQWNGFKGNRWKEKIDVRNFIGMNYTPYDGDASFLEGPTEATNKLWGKLQALQKEERAKGGVLDMETEVVTSLTAYGPGYIDEETKDLEKVVGLQTDKPLKRGFMTSIFIRSSFILFVSLPDMPVPDCSIWSFRSHSAKALLPVQWYRSAYLPYSHRQTETGFCKTYCPLRY